MLACNKITFFLSVLLSSINFCLLRAQPLNTLHSFNGGDGSHPDSPLVLSSNTLYGTTSSGNTVFAINTDGTGFTTLYKFSGGADGAGPIGRLVLSGSNLYGTTELGGTGNGGGTVFSLRTDGTAFTNLYSFHGYDGAGPEAGLVLSADTLYGTTFGGGTAQSGTVFKINTDGTGFATLHNFTAGNGITNIDGGDPRCGLVVSGNTLYGTTYYGGSGGNGTIFAVNTDGTGFRVLYNFAEGRDELNSFSNVGGANPGAGMVLSGETLYGTAENGGALHGGTVFKIDTNGANFVTLHDLDLYVDRVHPQAGLALSGNILYGTAGIVFEVSTNGTGYTIIYAFDFVSQGYPQELISSGNTLYGVTPTGGTLRDGTVFSLFTPPRLTINPFGEDLVLTWPTNSPGFSLQATTNLVPPVTWTTVSPGAVVINGQNVITNSISAAQQFYRLSQ